VGVDIADPYPWLPGEGASYFLDLLAIFPNSLTVIPSYSKSHGTMLLLEGVNDNNF
jgi:hypothetical protein